MSATVWKYPVFMSAFTHSMPYGAKVFHVDLQDGAPFMWAWVDPDAVTEVRWFVVVRTGHPAPSPKEARHVGTWLDGEYVWHLFEQAINPNEE